MSYGTLSVQLEKSYGRRESRRRQLFREWEDRYLAKELFLFPWFAPLDNASDECHFLYKTGSKNIFHDIQNSLPKYEPYAVYFGDILDIRQYARAKDDAVVW